MVLNKEIKLSVDKLENLTTLYLKQYENKTTTLKLEDLEPEEGYRYLFVYKKENEKKAYELPIENKSVGLDNYITNTAGVFFATIVAINAESEAVAIGETFRIVVQEGVYNEETATPSLPEPLESKYAQLVALMQDLEQKVASGYFKGEPGEPGKQGDDGFSPIAKVEPIPNGAKVVITDKQGTTEATILNGSDYELTEADKKEIAGITEEAIKPTLEKKMETYRVEVWDIDTPNARFEHIKEDGTRERVYYADLIEKYANPKYFLYCEYTQFGITLIPSLPPLDYDQILEFTCNWEYSGVAHQSRVIVNSDNQIKFNDREIAQKSDIKVDDVKVNGTSIVTDGVANVPIANNTNGVVKVVGDNFGVYLLADGTLRVGGANTTQIDQRVASKPIMPSTIDYAVKQALCDGKGQAYTEQEKAMARERLGAISGFTDTIEIETTEDASYINVQLDYVPSEMQIEYELKRATQTSSYVWITTYQVVAQGDNSKAFTRMGLSSNKDFVKGMCRVSFEGDMMWSTNQYYLKNGEKFIGDISTAFQGWGNYYSKINLEANKIVCFLVDGGFVSGGKIKIKYKR